MTEIDIVGISRELMVAKLTTGELVPIVSLLDEVGDETDDWKEAAAFVAGPTRDGMWLKDVNDNFAPPTRH